MSERPLIFDDVTQKFKSDVEVGAANPFVRESGVATLTNKTLTSPTLTSPALTSPVITGKPTTYSTDTTISGDGAIDFSLGDLFLLTKGSAAAITLADPAAADNGRIICIRSGSAFAHVITLASGIGGVASTDDIITFTNRASASITLKAINAKWWIVGSYLAAVA